MSNKKVLLLAIICGLLTAVAVNFYLKSVKETAVNAASKKVAVANVRIPKNTLVTPEMIVFKNIPLEIAHSSAVTDSSQVIGYTARAEIEAGEQVLQTKLVPKESTGNTLAYSVPLGYRAISVEVDEQSGVSGLLTPGDRVDVMSTLDIEEQSKDPNVNTIKHTKTHLILQNVQVLAVGRKYTDPAAQQGDPAQDKEKNEVNTVTLAVPPDKMQLLVHVVDKGSLTLALRAPADNSIEERPSIDALQLLR